MLKTKKLDQANIYSQILKGISQEQPFATFIDMVPSDTVKSRGSVFIRG